MIIAIPPEDISRVWDQVGPMLQLALDKGNGIYELPDVKACCGNGQESDRSQHRVPSPDIIGNYKRFISGLPGKCSQGAFFLVCDGNDPS